jgi:hypothetical protein
MMAYSCTSVITADINGDCQVNFLDEAMLAGIWSTIVPPVNIVTNGTFDTALTPWALVNITLGWYDRPAGWLTCGRAPVSECWQ